MTTERRPRFDRVRATLVLAAALLGLGAGAAARVIAATEPAPAAPGPPALTARSVPTTVIVVRGSAGRPAARTRAS